MTEETTERVNMNWPVGLKERVRQHAGTRGLTDFVVGATETRLVDEDRVKTLEKEVDELHYLVQLIADRYVMGGDHENREAFLMELDLPAWLRTDGWPADLAKLVPKREPVAELVSERVPSRPPAPITGEARPSEPVAREYSDEDLHQPSYAVAARQAGKSPAPASPEVREALGEAMITPGGSPAGTYTTEAIQTPVEDPAPKRPDDFFARVQAKAAEKGLDISGAGLVPASTIQAPPSTGPHNHAYRYTEEHDALACACGAWIDESAGKPGVVRESGWRPGDPTEPAPEPEPLPNDWRVPAVHRGEHEVTLDPMFAVSTPTPVVQEAPSPRVLDDFDVDF